ncbi:MAG: acylphosphatase [Chitinophagaceae bacterium]|nr:MAG: acylphosphatase [Chitinophagaceae bacterium]
MSTSSFEINVYGKVQGVFFRAYTLETAEKLSLKGFVKNMNDGSVYIFVQGKLSKIEELIEWCKKGSPNAEVSNVISNEVKSSEQFTDFTIRH